jgi:hypothetical protein
MRIFDCVLVTGESDLDLLEARFTEFTGIPGLTHVIAECTAGHDGNPKPLHFGTEQNRYGRFAPWYGRWTHVQVLPGELPDKPPRERKDALREFLAHGLDGGPGDLILHGSTDEIPRGGAVRHLAENPPEGPVALEMRMCAYRPGLVHPRPWRGTSACRWGEAPGFTWLREQRHQFPAIIHAGTRMALHRQPPQDRYPDGKLLRPVPVDGTWPQLVRERPDMFGGPIAPPGAGELTPRHWQYPAI